MGLSEDGMLAVIPVPHPVRALCSINCSIVLVKWHKHPNLQGFFFFLYTIGQGGVSSGLFVSHLRKSPYYSIASPFSNSSRVYLYFGLAQVVLTTQTLCNWF